MVINDIVRVYPIRTTKKEWNIPLHCYHICTERCSRMYIIDPTYLNTLRYILVNNPTYVNNQCQFANKLEETFIRLYSFDLEDPNGGTGPLYDHSQIIIPDNEFSLLLTYPLTHPVEVTIQSDITLDFRGFTLSEILYSIKILYKNIYDEEESTSTPRVYRITKSCINCENKNIQDYVYKLEKKDLNNSSESVDCNESNNDNTCSVCYSEYTEFTGGKLNCNHCYHKECILRWLESANTCPLCRKNIIDCDKCDGSGEEQYDYHGVVIPIEHRGSILNRNRTDGIFGIFGHDLEDLTIENLHYNRINKVLSVYIGS